VGKREPRKVGAEAPAAWEGDGPDRFRARVDSWRLLARRDSGGGWTGSAERADRLEYYELEALPDADAAKLAALRFVHRGTEEARLRGEAARLRVALRRLLGGADLFTVAAAREALGEAAGEERG
jgi:hypothetical protein